MSHNWLLLKDGVHLVVKTSGTLCCPYSPANSLTLRISMFSLTLPLSLFDKSSAAWGRATYNMQITLHQTHRSTPPGGSRQLGNLPLQARSHPPAPALHLAPCRVTSLPHRTGEQRPPCLCHHQCDRRRQVRNSSFQLA